MNKNKYIQYKNKKIYVNTKINNNENQVKVDVTTIAPCQYALNYVKAIAKEFNKFSKSDTYCNDDFKEFIKKKKAEIEDKIKKSIKQ